MSVAADISTFGSTDAYIRKVSWVGSIATYSSLLIATYSTPTISLMYQQLTICTLQVLEGWFLDTPIEKIHRENMASWCSWAFFDSDLSDLTAAEYLENDKIVSYIEHGAKWQFPPGMLLYFGGLSKVNYFG